MILKLPEPDYRTYESNKYGSNLRMVGESLSLGVRQPRIKPNEYVIREGYSYLWEHFHLCDGSDIYTIWLLYPSGMRPTEIEIEDYEENELIHTKKYNEAAIKKIKDEAAAEREFLKKRNSCYLMKKFMEIKGVKELPSESIEKIRSIICGTHNYICQESYLKGKE